MENAMAENKTAVFGIFAARSSCERAANELISAGFSPADFSVLPPEPIAGAADAGADSSTRPDATIAASPGASLAATLASLGISASEATICEARVREGGVLFCVYCDSAGQIEAAKGILTRNGAKEIDEASEARIAKKEREAEKAAGAE
jgi:hypothetical protein